MNWSSAWINGPEFLRTEDWPFQPPTQRVPVKSPKLIQDPPVAQQATMSSASKCVEPFIIWTNYSSYTKLVRTVAYMLRVNPKFRDSVRTSTIDPGELRRAEAKLLLWAQSEMFPKEQKALAKREYVASNSIIAAFLLFVGRNGLIRAAGRLKRLSAVPYETKHPVVLDGRHPLARFYLKHVHDSNHHQGVDFMRAHVQKTFAVIKLRSNLRSIRSCCVTCRKHRATPVTPLIAHLPKERLGYQERPFTYTGVDYFGPFHVSVRRSTEKRWGFLFTCMTTRAVHIEIVPKMDTSSCVMGIERFAARRGHPHTIWSDNGTNFVGADEELALCFANLDPDKVAQTSVRPKALNGRSTRRQHPITEGFGSALFRAVSVSYKILGNRRLTDEVLRTTFCLVEQFLNLRPLTAASSDPKDQEALTPNHFLFGGPSAASLFHVPEKAQPDDHRQRYRKSIAYANAIWHRWLTEYAPTLNVRSKWNRQDPTTLKTGDLVWIVETTSPRGFYPLARVKELHCGCDGIARSAVIRSSAGVFTRPTTKLVSVFDSSSPRREDVAYAD